MIYKSHLSVVTFVGTLLMSAFSFEDSHGWQESARFCRERAMTLQRNVLLCWAESMCTWEGRTPARLKRGRSPSLYHGTHRTAYGRHRTHGKHWGVLGPGGSAFRVNGRDKRVPPVSYPH